MKSTILTRLSRLEQRKVDAARGPSIRFGYVTDLPPGFEGESHIAIVKREPESPAVEWCEFEERPGPEPVEEGEYGLTVMLTR